MRKFPAVLFFLGVFALSIVSANAGPINQTIEAFIPFEAENSSIWDASAPVFTTPIASLERFGVGGTLGPTGFSLISDLSTSDFGLGDIIDVSLGTYGAEAKVSAFVDAGVQTSITNLHQGSLDINVPVEVIISFPIHVQAGEQFTISSSFNVNPVAKFQSEANQSTIELNAFAEAEVDFSGKICIVSCTSFDENLLSIDQTFNLLTQTPDATILPGGLISNLIPGSSLPFAGDLLGVVGLEGLQNELDDLGFGGTGNIQIPGSSIDIRPEFSLDGILDTAIAFKTGLTGGIEVSDLSQQSTSVTSNSLGLISLEGTRTDVAMDFDFDVGGGLAGALNIPVPLHVDLPEVLGFTVEGGLFDLQYHGQVFTRQELMFEGTPILTLEMGELGTHTMPLGGSIELTAPIGGMTEVQITPTVNFQGVLTNKTTVATAAGADMRIIFLNTAYAGLDFGSIGPGCLGLDTFFGCVGLDIDEISLGSIGEGIVNIGPVVDEEFFNDLFQTLINGTLITVDACDEVDNMPICNALALDSLFGIQSFTDTVDIGLGTFALPTARISFVPGPPALPIFVFGLAIISGLSRYRWRRRDG